MHFIKSFFSHLFAIIIFFIILFLSSTSIVRNMLVHDTISNTISETNYIDEIIKEQSSEYEGMEEIWEYIDIENIITEYLTNKILYELKLINEEPKINLDQLNEEIATGIESYIDDQIDSYTGGLNSYLEGVGIDLGIEDEINKYINESIGIDLTNNEIIKEEDLDELYQTIDEAFIDLRESTYFYEVLDIIYNNTLRIILIIVVIVLYIIISLINWNAVTGLSYMIAPLAINAFIFLIAFIASISIDVSGTKEAAAINYLINEAGSRAFKQFIILLLITIVIIFLYYIGKILSIRISHKTGKTTLDTFFDDYNRDEVVKELQEAEEIIEIEEKE